MKNKENFSSTFLVDQTPQEVFHAVNRVTRWWTENVVGKTENLNDEFEVRFGEVHYSKQRLLEVIPNERVVWLITDSKLNFIKNQSEWTNTRVVFEISVKENKTQLLFTHEDLVPEIECYGACSNAWTEYIQGSLYKLITTGKGEPTPKEVAVSE